MREALGVAEQPRQGFAELLRQLRAEARLTQEELAEAASLSPRSVSDLERGIHRTAQKDTARLLADALGLPEPVRALFVAAARGRGPIADVLAASREAAPGAAAAAATRTLPRDTVSFTGRGGDLGRLLEALTPKAAGCVVLGIHAIDGMAGVGKTALAVHAAHRLAGSFPDGQFFLPLHAHTPGQRPVDPADALASLLLTAGLTAQQIPPGPEARAARWRDYVAGKKILLLLDDAAGHDQVRPLLPGSAGSLVLITSRRRLAALGDAAQISLDTLSPEDASVLLVRLAARPGMDAEDAAIGEIARLCGYLPLAIGMLASKLRNHPARTASSVAAELSAARDRLALMHAENVSVSAAFGLSYTDLTPGQQQLFRRLGLVPGPSVDAYAAAALDGTGLDTARRHLDELYDQHLVTESAPGRYQMHDLLREHARALVASDDAEGSDEAVARLLDYYLHSAVAAGQHFSWGSSAVRRSQPGPPPSDAPDLNATGSAAAWLAAERVNLQAAADYAEGHGRTRHAVAIPTAIGNFLTIHGHWDQSAALARTALTAARQAGDRLGEADAVSWLGTLQRETGDYPAAAASLSQALTSYADLGDVSAQAFALNQMGFLQVLTGEYPAAAASHGQALALAREAGDRVIEANTHINMGLLQQLTGDHPAATASLELALAMFGDLDDLHGQAQALNCLGVVQQETGDYSAAAATQQRAMALFRDFGNRMGQAYSLNDLGLVQQDIGDYQAAAASHRQALALFGDLGNRLGEAEALNRLGELATRTSATGQARERHAQALAIARDISAAPEEARALEGLGQSHLRDGNSEDAAVHLQQALVIYERIGAHGARRIQKTFQSQMPVTATPAPRPTADGSVGAG